MSKQITVTVNGKQQLAAYGITLSELISGEKPCGGHGKCGKCKVIARGELSEITDAEKQLLTQDELAKSSDMKYINGQNTVTYFGAVLFSLDGE